MANFQNGRSLKDDKHHCQRQCLLKFNGKYRVLEFGSGTTGHYFKKYFLFYRDLVSKKFYFKTLMVLRGYTSIA